MAVAVWSRKLQFCAGPNDYTFHVCDECKPCLEGAWPTITPSLFFSTPDEPIRPVDPDDEIGCDGCRDGG